MEGRHRNNRVTATYSDFERVVDYHLSIGCGTDQLFSDDVEAVGMRGLTWEEQAQGEG